MTTTRIFKTFLILFFAVTASSAYADAQQKGPRGGVILKDGEHQYEVKVDQKAGKVHVYSLTQGKHTPEKMELSLLTDPQTGESVALRAVRSPDSKTPLFQGSLSQGQSSYIGVELKIPLNRQMWKRLTAPLTPTSNER